MQAIAKEACLERWRRCSLLSSGPVAEVGSAAAGALEVDRPALGAVEGEADRQAAEDVEVREGGMRRVREMQRIEHGGGWPQVTRVPDPLEVGVETHGFVLS